ncbi:hypothetical protein PHMEG_0008484 [Phytophthora megakarya]|uniref:Reverse transcriptase n=1 Tax=Phytophthora megakarya TaxID=4795 RepID=A0A225WJZ2_9STRA|nr:hypothetical protein PHMEG_0008484 [Phytophthora megakarya]
MASLYGMDVWVTIIGEGVGVHLGMDFVFSAGVRLLIRNGMGYTIRKREYRDIPVCPLRGLNLRPGEHANVVIRYGQCRRGDLWVTQIVYGARSGAVAIKEVNVSDRECWIDPRTPVARIAEYGNILIVGPFIIQENTLFAKARMRQEVYEQMLREAAPPAVMVPKYKWPTKLLVRPREPERAQVTKIVEELQPQKDTDGVGLAENATLEAYSPSVIGSLMAVEVSPEVGTLDVNAQGRGDVVNSGSCGEGLDEMVQESEYDAFQDVPRVDDEDFELPSSAMPGTPLARLDAAYARCMRVSAEELDLESAVYNREGSELMSQLKDQLVMLPDLDDLSPECDIEAADVGEPVESTEAQEKQLKADLKRHRNIFLGDGNAAPLPARGAICDLNVGNAKPVYKLLKKLLEATLIEHSESPWAFPIAIVLKKNGVDIRMHIDYRAVKSFNQLSNYSLPLIDDLITGFEGMTWFMSLNMASGF